MDREEYNEYKSELEDRIDKLEIKLDNLNEEYEVESEDGNDRRCHELELEISKLESELAEARDDLYHLCDNYDVYASERAEYHNEEYREYFGE